MDIGQAIKTLRVKRNMTQLQLAELCDMSINGVSMLETGKRFPHKSTMKKLCEAFDIPQSYLLLAGIDEGDMPEEKRVLYRAVIEPLRDELLQEKES